MIVFKLYENPEAVSENDPKWMCLVTRGIKNFIISHDTQEGALLSALEVLSTVPAVAET